MDLVKLARDLTRPGPPNGGLVREIPLLQENPGWWNIVPFGQMDARDTNSTISISDERI